MLAVALIALAVALLAGLLVDGLWSSPYAGAAATVIMWVGLGGVIVYAFRQSRPAGLLRFRALDVLYGVMLGLILRIVQGWIETGERGAPAFPSVALVDGRVGIEWWVVDVAGALVVAPVLEELFFRGVLLVAVYSALRRPFGAVTAGITAVLASSGLFVIVHALVRGGDLSGTLSLFLLGLVCGSLVVLTGRVWSAVILHVIFNASYLALMAVGTLGA